VIASLGIPLLPPSLDAPGIDGCVALTPLAVDHMMAHADNLVRLEVDRLPLQSPVVQRGDLFQELPKLKILSYGWLDWPEMLCRQEILQNSNNMSAELMRAYRMSFRQWSGLNSLMRHSYRKDPPLL